MEVGRRYDMIPIPPDAVRPQPTMCFKLRFLAAPFVPLEQAPPQISVRNYWLLLNPLAVTRA
jgi:hypothetical protein